MTYATQDDLIDRVGERLLIDLTDREEQQSLMIDADAVAQALGHADAEINGYLADRYVLPLSEVPPTIVDLACVLAIWRLHTYEPTSKIKADYDEAQRKLREIARGVFRLPVDGVEPANTGTSGAQFTDRERPFTETSMKSFI